MPQHDYSIANGSGAAVRSDLNNALAAIVSNNSGNTAPTPAYEYMPWADTNLGLYKIYVNGNWVTVGTLADTNLGLLARSGGTMTGALLADDSGTAALPAIAFDGDPDTGAFRAGANQYGIATNGVERVEWGTSEVVFNDGGDNYDFRIEGDTEANLIFVDASADTVSFRDDVYIDGSGRLLVGTSTAQGNNLLQVQQSGGGFISLRRNEAATAITADEDLGGVQFQDNGGNVYAEILAEADGTAGSGDYPGRLVFSTTADGAASPTERMRISQNGQVLVSNALNPLLLVSTSTAGTTNFLLAGNNNITTSVYIWTNGNIQNTNGSYTTISDVKLKENIVDAGSQWDDLKAIRIRNWNFKAETGHETHRQIGPIAQELEQVCPGLVFETSDRDEDGNDLGTVTKGVNQSVLYMKAVKALQEAMERIEALEASNADLLARVSALESA